MYVINTFLCLTKLGENRGQIFRAAMVGLRKYSMGGYGQMGVYWAKEKKRRRQKSPLKDTETFSEIDS